MSYKLPIQIRPIITPIQTVSKYESETKAEEITEVIYQYKKKYNNFNIICSIIALILSWNCNKGSSIYLKLLYSIVAIILSYWYLLFYLVYYIYLNKNCSDEITFDITFNDIQNRLFPQNL
jgi:hypothetical protein